HVIVSERWKTEHPRGGVGVLAIDSVVNPATAPELAARKQSIESELRGALQQGGKEAIKSLPRMQAYAAFYKKYGQTYHVQRQIESVVLQGRTLPNRSALVDNMFMHELYNGLLTAGHNLNAVDQPVTIDSAKGTESYTTLSGKMQQLKAGDMYMSDSTGIISSVLFGPDARTPITPETTAAMFVVYAPDGIEREWILSHLSEVESGVKTFAPNAKTILRDVFGK
ncbi:MAG TPA: hypothetical protein VMU84_05165, partial [Thermoanaerobaculia bacterium]|nr:hypothetical protein [Thermoanaerobaculia bacterium]